jgi:hypothetical protein
LTLGGDERKGPPMSRTKETKRRLAPPRMSYSSRVHLKRRLQSIDYRFLAAVAALALATAGAVRFL